MTYVAVVEMPMHTPYKFEIDAFNGGKLVLDRPLLVSVPFNYGYIKDTIADDGDALDVFILSHKPIPSLTEVKLEVLGVLKCVDNGKQDDKIVAKIKDDIQYMYEEEEDLEQLRLYLKRYKEGFEVGEYLDAEKANELILNSKISVGFE